MDFKKVLICLASSLIFVMILTTGAFCHTAQKIIIPYATVGGDWWTGLAIHNESNTTEIYILDVYDENGTLIGTSDCITIDPHATRADLIENFISETVNGRISIYIKTTGASTDRFSATVFLGNSGNSSQGFGFQTYRSEDYETPFTIMCIIPTL